MGEKPFQILEETLKNIPRRRRYLSGRITIILSKEEDGLSPYSRSFGGSFSRTEVKIRVEALIFSFTILQKRLRASIQFDNLNLTCLFIRPHNMLDWGLRVSKFWPKTLVLSLSLLCKATKLELDSSALSRTVRKSRKRT